MTTEAQSKYNRITPLYFEPLAPDGTNFLDWQFNIRTYLSAEELIYTLHPNLEKPIEPAHKWQTRLILCRHLDPSLRMQYIHEEDPAILWGALESRFQHEETIILPQARSNWLSLRVLDFPNFHSYDSELHRIVAQLRICGQSITDAAMIDKTLSTFPPACAILSQQYRNLKFTKHADLMRYPMIAEKQQQLLLKTAETRPARKIHNTEASKHIMTSSTSRSGGTHDKSHVPAAPKRTPRGNWRHNPWNRSQRYGNQPHQSQSRFQSRSQFSHSCLLRSRVIVMSVVDLVIGHAIVTLASTYVTCIKNFSP